MIFVVFFIFSEGFTDENSKWLKPAKRKRKIDEPESEDDSEEHWEERRRKRFLSSGQLKNIRGFKMAEEVHNGWRSTERHVCGLPEN